MRVLLVEDDEMVRETLVMALEDAGYPVTSVEHGGQAINVLKKQQFDLMITDMMMPVVSGTQAIAVAKKQNPDMKIVAISGGGRNGDNDFLGLAKEIGADATLKKPFKCEQLLLVINSFGQALAG